MIWHPIPRGLVNAAAAERWTRKRPAPKLVVYAWIWSQHDDGERPSRRDIRDLFGWTEHGARTMIARVKEDRNAWLQAYSPKHAPRTAQQPPSRPSHSKHLEPQAAQQPPRVHQETPDRACAFTLHSHTHTTNQP